MKTGNSYFSRTLQGIYEKISFWGIDHNASEIEKILQF